MLDNVALATRLATFLLLPTLILGQGDILPVWITNVPEKTPFMRDGPPMYTGRAWKSWTEDFKTGFLVGINEGSFIMGTIHCTCYSALLPESGSLGQVKQALDKFFMDPDNIRIHVIEALEYLATEKAKQQEYLVGLRNRNKP